MTTKRSRRRGGSVLVYETVLVDFNEKLEFMMHPSPTNEYQPIQVALEPPPGLSELHGPGSYSQRKAQPLLIHRIDYGDWTKTNNHLSPPKVSGVFQTLDISGQLDSRGGYVWHGYKALSWSPWRQARMWYLVLFVMNRLWLNGYLLQCMVHHMQLKEMRFGKNFSKFRKDGISYG